jgi:O-antigen/teichoic acid export membrane protein
MSLKQNILANYASQIYVTVIGIVMVPLYIRYLGTEAYGLVGFFAMLQVWFQVLDMGLTPTMARESARFNGGAIGATQLRRLLRAMEGIFVGIAMLGAIGLAACSGMIAERWLKVQQLPIQEVQLSIALIAVIVALRWVSGLYRGAITGFEKLVWLGGFNIVFATVRFVLVIPFFIYVGATPTKFFAYQLLLAIIELLVLVMQTYRLLPPMNGRHGVPWQWDALRDVVKFSISISLASLAWVMATQADKLLLSKLLPLTEYGYFTLVALVAGGILAVSSPISGALLPRLTKLNAAGNFAGLLEIYRLATQLVVAVAVPAALVLCLFPDKVLWAWTGNPVLMEKVAPVLTLYSLGSCISVIAAFPYYLQYAKGNLQLHLLGSLLFVMVSIPILIYTAGSLGMVGAGWAWLLSNVLYFSLWVPLISSKFAPGFYWSWVVMDVLVTSVPAIVLAFAVRMFFVWADGQLAMGIELLVVATLLFGVCILSGSKVRPLLVARLRH